MALTDGLTQTTRDTTVNRGTTYAYLSKYSGGTVYGPFIFTTREKKFSQSHAGFRRYLGRGDVGGPFLVEKQVYDDLIETVDTRGISGKASYVLGPFWPLYSGVGPTSTVWPALGVDLYSEIFHLNLQGLGTTAISRCAPTKPQADSMVAAAELIREGIPKMLGSSLRTSSHALKGAGDEYLNYQFGWKPLMSDLRKISRSIMNSDDYLRQLERNSGRKVKRSYQFPDVKSESVTTIANVNGNPPGPMSPTWFTSYTGTRYTTTTSEQETWFDGCFTYHFDLKGSSSWDAVSNAAKKARHLYGLKLTPDVVWNLMPWSWLADWGGNFGDVMSNVALFSNDGLVMQYGYVMQHRKVSKRYDLKGIVPRGYSREISLQQTFSTESKVRLPASPFGFGLTFDGLSARQLSILAALGITRRR